MNPYFKTTKGYNAEVIVAKDVAYTTQLDIESFVLNAVEGEIGAYNTVNSNLIAGVAVVGTEIVIIQMRDGQIHKTSPFKVEDGIGVFTPYQVGSVNEWQITATGLPVSKGKILEVALVELSAGAQPYKVFNFYVEVKTAETLAQALTRLAAIISDANHPQWYAYGQVATASAAAGVLTIVSTDTSRFFKVVVRQDLGDAVLEQTVAPTLGSGSPEGIAAIEGEGVIFDGETTNYPLHGNPSEYGQATRFTDASKTYDVVVLTAHRKEDSPMPFHQHVHKSYIFLALPSNGLVGSPKEAITDLFGF